ncbi:Crp/Fnr family transcriptional regulator [Reyranella soli]|uniref:Catabolite gene activator protein n=1 Tax=Reyranella soli TaxID=1230389 RepID=A0A512N5H1_9HYPH|nr:Crp/Fnr family transcriptional regulator [Reyranella soli]GEP54208.1 catabolite gene activator protein [Reyranella soli]
MRPPDLFARHPLFSALAEDQARELLRRAPVKRFQAGEIVFRRGDPGDGLYGVLTGSILIVAESAKGSDLIINKHGSGEVFGELAMLDGKGRSAAAVAHETSELIHVRRDKFLPVLRQQPDAMIHIISFISNRLRRITDVFEDAALLDVPTRLAKQIVMLSEATGAPDSPVTLRITQNDLARMLGVSREFVGKQLVAWRAAGIVELGRQRLTVRDIRALRKRIFDV